MALKTEEERVAYLEAKFIERQQKEEQDRLKEENKPRPWHQYSKVPLEIVREKYSAKMMMDRITRLQKEKLRRQTGE